MKIGLLREEKTPPDKRVPLTPEQCIEVMRKFTDTEITVQTSRNRVYTDKEYRDAGIQVQEDLNRCDILLGIKEVNPDKLIPGKIYLFFSHTIKMQPQNRRLLQQVLERKVWLIDYEILTNKRGKRIIGFGHFAGLVGTYNGFRAIGLRSGLFELKPAHLCYNLNEMLAQLDHIKVPPIKIAVTGDGRVAGGVLEILYYLKIKHLTPYQYLKVKKPERPVFVQLAPHNYVQRTDGTRYNTLHFYTHPEMYQSTFLPFARSSDVLIAAAYWDPNAPVLFTRDDMRSETFRIRIISDITCDIDGSVPSTKKAASIDQPFYDYNPATGKTEAPFSGNNNITVQAVDNLPCELPRDASDDFGRNLIDFVLPAVINNRDSEMIKRATIAKGGKLTKQFSYLQKYASMI